MTAEMTREITVIGGGTGSFNLLSGLRAQTDFTLRSIVTVMDSGGDSGVLRDAFGVLPPGDLRRWRGWGGGGWEIHRAQL
jgi:2-phospho-L-lactate transferase/gluconeogenesis factor (CofD/UPF0052 family)